MRKWMIRAFLAALCVSLLIGAKGAAAEEKSAYVRTATLLDRLNVRQAPGATEKIAAKLCWGAKVSVLKEKNGWALIVLRDERDGAAASGYVQAKYLDFSGRDDEKNSENLVRVRVTADAYGYIEPYYYFYFETDDQYTLLPAGTELTVLGVRPDFDANAASDFDTLLARMDDGHLLWLNNWSQFGLEVVRSQGLFARTAASVRLRRAADKESEVLLTLKAGAKVEVLLRGEGWTMVKYKDQTGYVMSRYLKFP